MAGQVHRFIELLQDRWGAVALIGLFFWGFGWLDLSMRRAGRPVLKAAGLALALVCGVAWIWMQPPSFLSQRWIAILPIVAWAVAVRLCGLKAPDAQPESRKPAAAAKGPTVLRQPRWVLGVGCIGILFFSAITLISNLVPNPTTTIVTTAAFAGFALLNALFALAVLVERYSIDGEGITSRSLVGAPRFVAWKDVVRIGYNPQMQWFYIKDRRGKTVRLSVILEGIAMFARRSLAGCPDAIDPELRAFFHAMARGETVWPS